MEYQSPFEDWYTYSTVHKPLPDFTCENGLVLFPPELVPGVGHPQVGNDATRRLMMRKLESYNAFTEKLEYEAVMAGSIKLAQNPRAFGLSEQAGREARLIVTDESHYAYVAVELIKGIRTSICAGRGFWRLGLTHTMLRSFCGITIRQTR